MCLAHKNDKKQNEKAKLLGISPKCVSSTKKRYEETGSVSDRSRSGIPWKLTLRDENYIFREIRKDPTSSDQKLATDFNIRPKRLRVSYSETVTLQMLRSTYLTAKCPCFLNTTPFLLTRVLNLKKSLFGSSGKCEQLFTKKCDHEYQVQNNKIFMFFCHIQSSKVDTGKRNSELSDKNI
ncbi:hypothetical protein BpHYR1_007010 [Brachionus plicatilis]|uniref:Homeodomain-like DNA binding domain-containing transcription factor n=1 Tax=Brachionus plicatilis TaxID=10195 RepID=A0A3M7SET3_BRAPC|nr:hypothetical protein BpHYR1_007010 [Brachionus plicatilis]